MKNFLRALTGMIVLLIIVTVSQPVKSEVYMVDFDESEAEFLMLEAINSFRYQNGLPLLSLDKSLSDVSRRQAIDMAQKDYFDHYSLEGLSPDDRVRRAGMPYKIRENIGIIRTFGEETEAVVNALMEGFLQSPSHRSNLINPDITHVGIGFYQDLDSLNHTLNLDVEPDRNYRGYGTVLVVQDFYRRDVSVVEPRSFNGWMNPGEFLDMKIRFEEKVNDAFIRILPKDESFEAYDIQLQPDDSDYGARFAIGNEGEFTLAIYASTPEKVWYYTEKGAFDLTVKSHFF